MKHGFEFGVVFCVHCQLCQVQFGLVVDVQTCLANKEIVQHLFEFCESVCVIVCKVIVVFSLHV